MTPSFPTRRPSDLLYGKDNGPRRCVIVDAAMNDLIRPSLYDAWHEIVPLAQPAAEAALRPVDVVGPICESSDTFARQRSLPPVAEGDLLAFSSAGAYSFVIDRKSTRLNSSH